MKPFAHRAWVIVTATLAMLIGFPSFFSVISFLNAVTPEEAGKHVPAHWSAGVRNHGVYYEWYTISDRPVLFVVSCIGLASSVSCLWVLLFLEWRSRRRASSR